MSLDYTLLRSLHRMLRQLSDISERIRKGPMKVKVVAANEANFLKAMEQAKENLTELRKASNAKQMQLAEREAKIEDMKNKLNICDSNKEFQMLKDRIAADLQANSVLQDEILEQLEKLDVLTEEAEQAKQNYAKSQTETQKMTDKVALDLKALESEKIRVTAELAEAEKGVPIDLATEYRRLVAGMGEDALASTDTETCGNCNQRMITQMVSDLMMKKAVFCKGCGSLLYPAENRAIGN
ncbi:MAG: zinc ribbon domain-containing protein [Mariniblastus sp.]